MSNQLYISKSGQIKRYICKTTHTGEPFLRVNSEYLDLTTQTATGFHMNIKYNNQTYRPVQSTNTVVSSTYTCTVATGYSGVGNSTNSWTKVDHKSRLVQSATLTAVTTKGYNENGWATYTGTVATSKETTHYLANVGNNSATAYVSCTGLYGSRAPLLSQVTTSTTGNFSFGHSTAAVFSLGTKTFNNWWGHTMILRSTGTTCYGSVRIGNVVSSQVTQSVSKMTMKVSRGWVDVIGSVTGVGTCITTSSRTDRLSSITNLTQTSTTFSTYRTTTEN